MNTGGDWTEVGLCWGQIESSVVDAAMLASMYRGPCGEPMLDLSLPSLATVFTSSLDNDRSGWGKRLTGTDGAGHLSPLII